MFYPASAGTVTSFAPVYPQNAYYNAPMSAVMPGQQYYPAPMMYPQTAAPIMMQRPGYGYGAPGYYGGTPTVVLPSRSSRHHRRHSSRRGFMGYL